MTNPNGLAGSLLCPDYNMVCTSKIWCNNIYDCIENGSTADETTFDIISNKEELLQRDKTMLSVNDNSKCTIEEINNGFNIKYEWSKLIRQFILLIINFM